MIWWNGLALNPNYLTLIPELGTRHQVVLLQKGGVPKTTSGKVRALH
jgi:hypothetical protein